MPSMSDVNKLQETVNQTTDTVANTVESTLKLFIAEAQKIVQSVNNGDYSDSSTIANQCEPVWQSIRHDLKYLSAKQQQQQTLRFQPSSETGRMRRTAA